METIKKAKSKFPLIVKDRVYKLLNSESPVSFSISSQDNKRSRLMHFDEEAQVNRPLRYARNMSTPYMDEQDDKTVILEPIVFEDGSLSVPKSNIGLQWFLHLHPNNGVQFIELDHEKEAKIELDDFMFEINAMNIAKELSIEQLEVFARQLLGYDPKSVASTTLRRDVLIYARNYPESFMSILDDPELDKRDIAIKAIDQNLLQYRSNGRYIYYNFPDNKSKLLTVPVEDTDGIEALTAYFNSPEGVDLFNVLKNELRDF